MALRRQGLSQRRRAVGLTQEALAQRLGVERSTVVRWEAGDTEPLPSIRPSLARALHMSIDHLAELLAESKDAGTTRILSAGTEVTIPTQQRPVSAELGPPVADTAPQAAIALDATLPALPADITHPAEADAAGTDVEPATVGATGFAGSDVQPRRARLRRFTWFAAAGVLALVLAEGAASMPFITSHRGPIPPTTGTPGPVAAIPAPEPGNGPLSEDSTGSVYPAPVAVPNKPIDGPATSGAAAAPARQTTRSDNRATSRSKPPAPRTRPIPPRNPVIPADAYEALSQAAALNESEEDRPRRRPEPPQRP